MDERKGFIMIFKEFPDFIKYLPQADLSTDGLRGWILQSSDSQVLFNETDIELVVSEHKHGEQWGIVVGGKIELTINGVAQVYAQGDSYHIPANALHSGKMFSGYRAVNYFADKNRYAIRL
jgi:hypothetical protein